MLLQAYPCEKTVSVLMRTCSGPVLAALGESVHSSSSSAPDKNHHHPPADAPPLLFSEICADD